MRTLCGGGESRGPEKRCIGADSGGDTESERGAKNARAERDVKHGYKILYHSMYIYICIHPYVCKCM